MDKILLAICNGLSCFIICTILFQFMNERYKKSYSNKTLYIAAEIAMGITAFGINMLNFAILNLLIWFVGVFVITERAQMLSALVRYPCITKMQTDQSVESLSVKYWFYVCLYVKRWECFCYTVFCRFVEYQILMLSCNIVWK